MSYLSKTVPLPNQTVNVTNNVILPRNADFYCGLAVGIFVCYLALLSNK